MGERFYDADREEGHRRGTRAEDREGTFLWILKLAFAKIDGAFFIETLHNYNNFYHK